jgi:hypothetical protein
MKLYRYPVRSLIGDYVRSAVGLAVGIGALISAPSHPAILIIFGGLTVLFLVFGLRTVRRQILKVAVTGEAICGSGFGTRVVSWDTLERLKLSYFGTRRQRSSESGGGFMQLTLTGSGATIRLESSIEGFEEIARRAARAARENGVSLDPSSAGNLLDLGIDIDAEQPNTAAAAAPGD